MARYISERERFTKRKNYDAEKQYVDNFMEFHEYVETLVDRHLRLDMFSAVVLAHELKNLLLDFETNQEKLLAEISN